MLKILLYSFITILALHLNAPKADASPKRLSNLGMKTDTTNLQSEIEELQPSELERTYERSSVAIMRRFLVATLVTAIPMILISSNALADVWVPTQKPHRPNIRHHSVVHKNSSNDFENPHRIQKVSEYNANHPTPVQSAHPTLPSHVTTALKALEGLRKVYGGHKNIAVALPGDQQVIGMVVKADGTWVKMNIDSAIRQLNEYYSYNAHTPVRPVIYRNGYTQESPMNGAHFINAFAASLELGTYLVEKE